MFFYKKLSISPKMTHGDNYIFAVFDLIFYYRRWELANDAPRWATKQEQSYLFNIRLKIHKIFRQWSSHAPAFNELQKHLISIKFSFAHYDVNNSTISKR